MNRHPITVLPPHLARFWEEYPTWPVCSVGECMMPAVASPGVDVHGVGWCLSPATDEAALCYWHASVS